MSADKIREFLEEKTGGQLSVSHGKIKDVVICSGFLTDPEVDLGNNESEHLCYEDKKAYSGIRIVQGKEKPEREDYCSCMA